MGNSKRKKEGQYVPLPYAQIKSAAWRSLSGSAVKVWLELHTRYNGGNNGKVRLSLEEASGVLGLGKATVQRAYTELEAKGFIVLMSKGNFYSRRAHEWRLTNKPMQTTKGTVLASQDWRNYRCEKQKRGARMEPSHLVLVPPQNRQPDDGTNTEPVRARKGRS